jgi:uncharacterized protein YbjT (DUF2867 family)
MKDDLVLVVGGTRSTGLHAAHLLRDGHVRVRVLARDPAIASIRVGPGIEIAPGDITRPDTLRPAFRGASQLIFTAGVRSGRFARQSIVRATEFQGVVNAIGVARAEGFGGRFVYMTAMGVGRRSALAFALNIWKGRTLFWRRHAEESIRSSGIDYTIVRAAVLLNARPNRHAILITQDESPLTLTEFVGRADVAAVLVEALNHRAASRATFEVKWGCGSATGSWPDLLDGLKPDTPIA